MCMFRAKTIKFLWRPTSPFLPVRYRNDGISQGACDVGSLRNWREAVPRPWAGAIPGSGIVFRIMRPFLSFPWYGGRFLLITRGGPGTCFYTLVSPGGCRGFLNEGLYDNTKYFTNQTRAAFSGKNNIIKTTD